MFSTQGKPGPASNRVSVEGSVVDRWASMLQDPSDQDLTVKTEDDQCTVHSSMLTLASPAVKAALASAMQEGSSKSIEASDRPVAAVKILMELVYTTDLLKISASDASGSRGQKN